MLVLAISAIALTSAADLKACTTDSLEACAASSRESMLTAMDTEHAMAKETSLHLLHAKVQLRQKPPLQSSGESVPDSSNFVTNFNLDPLRNSTHESVPDSSNFVTNFNLDPLRKSTHESVPDSSNFVTNFNFDPLRKSSDESVPDFSNFVTNFNLARMRKSTDEFVPDFSNFVTNFNLARLRKSTCSDDDALANVMLFGWGMSGGCAVLSTYCSYIPSFMNPCKMSCNLCPKSTIETITVSISTANPQFSVQGFVEDGVSIFAGIPYSKSRAPPNRFKPPEEYVHEPGSTFSALEHGPKCVQSSGKGDEDCLNLDIYAPHNHDKISSVLVYIHGGAWMSGTKNDYRGKKWASKSWHKDVSRFVVVVLNYRLNILGFPDFGDNPTNLDLGTRDCIMALQWVKNHIGNFGGNTNSITIFGESAGAMNVLNLWVSPQARGLFHRAISQSPYIWDYDQGTSSPGSSRKAKKEEQMKCMNAAMELAGPDSTFQTPTLAQLKEAGCFGSWYGPQSDGSTILQSTFYSDICAVSDVGAGVPLLVGHNALEVSLWVTLGMYSYKQDQMTEWVEHLMSISNEQAECVMSQLGELYAASGKMQTGSNNYAKHHYATSGIFFNMMVEVLSRSPSVYQYVFNESIPGTYGQLCEDGAHACEVAFVISEEAGFHSSVEEGLEARMRNVWAQFASAGNPGWHTDSIGKFSEGELQIDPSGAPFHPDVSQFLHDIMCAPDKISTSCA